MKFSIIIPTYNRQDTILRAVDSVLKQDFPDYELLVIDDGSTDNTKKILEEVKDKRLKYFYQENAERSAARNKGIEIAQGEWICFLDSDDYFDDDYLALLNQEFNKNEQDCFFVGYKRKHNDDNQFKIIPSLPDYPNIVEYCIQQKLPIGICEIICRKKVYERFKFPVEFNVWEDTHIYYRILSNFTYSRLNIHGYNVILHNGSGVYSAEHNVDLKMVSTYIKAIDNLFSCHNQDLQLISNHNLAKTDYIHAKYQMFFYRAIQTKDLNSAHYVLDHALKNKGVFRDLTYYLKSFIKLFKLKLDKR